MSVDFSKFRWYHGFDIQISSLGISIIIRPKLSVSV